MNREKFAWLLSIVLIAILAAQMPHVLAHRDDDYNFVRTLIDIHRQVTTNYVDQPEDAKLQQGAIDGMLAQLDPFTTYVPPANQEVFDNMLEGSFKGVGIQLDKNDKGEIEVITPIDNTPAAKAGVEAGDVILKVNGEVIQTLNMDEISKRVRGPLGSSVTLSVRHVDGTTQDLTMVRDDILVPTIKGYARRAGGKVVNNDPWDYWVSNDPKIAYIRITQFTADTYVGLKKVMDKLMAEHMKGLIIDLRFNPGGRLDQAKEVVNLFVSDGVIVKVKGRNRPEEITYAKKDAALPPFPMVVLVNEHSASASEIVAGSLMDNKRALIVGQRSYGKGSVQEVIPLEGNNGELKLTVAYYYLPSGRLVHRKKDSTDWGVEPQLVIPMDLEQEKQLMKNQLAADLIHGPSTQPATVPTTIPATSPSTLPTTFPTTSPTTAPSTEPIDPQFTAALDALIADVRGGPNTVVPPIPATQPTATTQPAATTQAAAAIQPATTQAH